MENNSNNKWLRILQPVGFILATILASMAIAVGGMKLASRFNLTTSREQAALSRLVLSGTEAVLPGRGTTTEGDGWVLRNTRGMYTLTLDGAEFEAQDGAAVEIDGDLTVELKRGSRNRIFSKGNGIRIHSGLLTIQGEGSLDIEAEDTGIQGAGKEKEADSPDRASSEAAVRIKGSNVTVRGKKDSISCRQLP